MACPCCWVVGDCWGAVEAVGLGEQRLVSQKDFPLGSVIGYVSTSG